jgi:hypothetical protein
MGRVAERMNYGRSSPVLVSRAFPFDRTSNPRAKRCLQQFRSQDRAARTGGSSRRRCDQTGAHPFLSSLFPSPPLARLWTSPSFGCLLLKKFALDFFSDES